MSTSHSINAAELPIESVCVFRANRAEVHRLVPVELVTGQNEVIIDKLPNVIDSDSIRVEGLGAAVILDVIYEPPPSASSSTTTPEFKAIKRTISKLGTQKKVVDSQIKILEDYSNTVTAETTDAAALGDFLQTFYERQTELTDKISEIKEKKKTAEMELMELKKAAFEDDEGRKRAVKVTVIIDARQNGKAKLSLRYMVTGASWQPLYDVRTKVSTTSKETPSVSLQYRASIAQKTGEDWTNVALTLSTASPQQGAVIPALTTFRIGRPSPPPPLGRKVLQAKSMRRYLDMEAVVDDDDEDMDDADSSDGGSGPPPPGPLAIRIAEAVEGAMSSIFAITGNSTIPSDGNDGKSTHKVSIAVLDLSADLEWIAVPKLQASAFLRCNVVNTSRYMLLEGPSNVFIDGSFVCKSTLPNVSPQEHFTTSLGVDPAIRITYLNQQKKTKTSSGGLLGAKHDVTSFTQRISVKNTRGTSIAPLFVKDQVPVSDDNDIKVVVHEPAALESPAEQKEVFVAAGVKARWAFRGTSGSEAGSVADDGVVEYVCDVGAGKSVELALVWDVLAPARQGWVKR